MQLCKKTNSQIVGNYMAKCIEVKVRGWKKYTELVRQLFLFSGRLHSTIVLYISLYTQVYFCIFFSADKKL